MAPAGYRATADLHSMSVAFLQEVAGWPLCYLSPYLYSVITALRLAENKRNSVTFSQGPAGHVIVTARGRRSLSFLSSSADLRSAAAVSVRAVTGGREVAWNRISFTLLLQVPSSHSHVSASRQRGVRLSYLSPEFDREGRVAQECLTMPQHHGGEHNVLGCTHAVLCTAEQR